MNCKACNAPLLGDSPEQICNQCKIEELIGENARLQSELARLKTPHTCGECEHYAPFLDNDMCADTNNVQIQTLGDCDKPWLCGHFKAKGQV